MYGGSVRVGPRREGGFEVCATLPVTMPEPGTGTGARAGNGTGAWARGVAQDVVTEGAA
jgi:hypothetical protein